HNNLALNIMKTMVVEAKEKWGSTMDIILVHRLGKLNLADISVYISVRAPHRDAAYSASRYLIEELKK
ncbi:MAG: molybdenum cofactor biosynthesis protein MoaE, partial [Candidatus Dadabacteria bacterium]|nr:molybdenum cofactor biosynthesis protein MoaE [Candidatus Dadabacteria bacterium]